VQGQNLQKLAGLYSAFKLQTLSTWVSWKLASSPRHNYCAAGKNNIYMMAGTKEKSQRKSMHLTIIGCSLLSETTPSVRFLLWQTRHVLAASCTSASKQFTRRLGREIHTNSANRLVIDHPCFRFWRSHRLLWTLLNNWIQVCSLMYLWSETHGVMVSTQYWDLVR